MTTNYFLCIMAGCFLFGTTVFFRDKCNDLEKQNKQMENYKTITDKQLQECIDKMTYLKNTHSFSDGAKWMRKKLLELNGNKQQQFNNGLNNN